MLGFLNVVIGGGLLLAGRKLFWLFVGAIGFMLGLEVASRFTFRSQWMLLVVALALGVVFALLAIFVETVALGIAGFVGGGLGLMRLAVLMGLDSPLARTLAFVVGAIIGVALVVWLFNWALIILSSAAGASMVAAGLFLRDVQRPLVYAALLVIGILVQAIAMGREHGRAKPTPQKS
ncbi:MAG TPA: hypothetical protein VFH29_02195 [Anaerolineales bacterium]|nr:hypothetical protein [Anaerolineales bacterium]